MDLFHILLKNLRKMEPLTVSTLTDGFRLACGLLVMAILFTLLLGHFGDYLTMYSCVKGAFSAAFGVFDATVIASLLGDLYLKERQA
ncbi:MAG: hypothetical protein ABF449_00510 [Ethanoligenens sp.]|uniref:hypothetical protein n=1 Tax=Ethanoligenens sp. TaxID=2099655 RepID=UPI0039E9B050